MRYLGEDELTQVMGIGYLGEVRQGPDGNLYQWVQGVDGLGNPVGAWWSRIKKFARRYGRYIPAVAALRAASPFLKRALPFVQKAASFIPLPQAQAIAKGLQVATPFLRQAGVAGAGYAGLGALYQAPDGTVYQVQGLTEDEELRGLGALFQAPDGTVYQVAGLDEDEELRGLGEDEELRGIAEDEELRGLSEDEELRGYGEDEDLRGFAEDEDLRGIDEGYVPEVSGLGAYVPNTPPATRWFAPSSQPPEIWKPLW